MYVSSYQTNHKFYPIKIGTHVTVSGSPYTVTPTGKYLYNGRLYPSLVEVQIAISKELHQQLPSKTPTDLGKRWYNFWS